MPKTDQEKAVVIPLHVRVIPDRPSDRDAMQHLVEFNVVGSEAPAVVVIASEMYGNPVITARVQRGGLDLPDRLMDSLAIKCFGVVAGFIIDLDGQCGSWTARDVTRWIRRQFGQADADYIIGELSRHVTLGIAVTDMSVVSDDDNV
ncbi:hypothetical protein BH09PLA1_BH09PLA1_18380 [soil metagenome]